MEIRRVDTELIPPPVASEHGAQVELHRRPTDEERRKKRQQRSPDESSPYAPALDDEEDSGHPVTVYGTDGHIQEHASSVAEPPHTLDQLA